MAAYYALYIKKMDAPLHLEFEYVYSVYGKRSREVHRKHFRSKGYRMHSQITKYEKEQYQCHECGVVIEKPYWFMREPFCMDCVESWPLLPFRGWR